MSDAKLRSLERQAQAGNPYAQRLLTLERYRYGQIPEENLFLMLDGSAPYQHIGVRVKYHEKYRRWVPDMDENYFFEYFLVNGAEATIVEATVIPNVRLTGQPMDSRDFDRIPLPVQQQTLGWVTHYAAEGFEILHDIKPLFRIDATQLYHPHAYTERVIPEYEDMPDYPPSKIIVGFKGPHRDLELFEVISDSDFLQKLIHEHWEAAPIGRNISMVTTEFPYGEPNFILEQAPFIPESHRSHYESQKVEVPEDLFHSRLQTIHGPVVFVKFIKPDFENINWNVMPWPWNEIAAKDPDKQGPAALEGQSLDEEDIDFIESIMKPIPVQIPVDATHFTPDIRGGAHIYNIDYCELCEKPAQGPNGLHVMASSAELEAAGLQKLDVMPGELGYSEEKEAVVCEECY